MISPDLGFSFPNWKLEGRMTSRVPEKGLRAPNSVLRSHSPARVRKRLTDNVRIWRTY